MNQREAFDATVRLAVASAMPEGDAADGLSLAHLREMRQAIETGEFSEAKLGRWLGWAQAALVAADVGITLDDVKAINMRHAGAPPADRMSRAIEVGREIGAISIAIGELGTAYGNDGRRHDAYESELFSELSARREKLRDELRGMG